ncbi:hypothetical protein J6590_091065 [Homalodisca vitripennis]|nr:hypothetical protein J6590_091065 [Homalodisca vitripennis]
MLLSECKSWTSSSSIGWGLFTKHGMHLKMREKQLLAELVVMSLWRTCTSPMANKPASISVLPHTPSALPINSSSAPADTTQPVISTTVIESASPGVNRSASLIVSGAPPPEVVGRSSGGSNQHL